MHRANVCKLYKTILRLHRALPEEMRALGDQYVKDEFRRHKTIAKEFVAPFMVEWSEYAITLAKQVGLRGPKTASSNIGKPLAEEKLEDFEGQQIYQLYELRKSISPIPEEHGGSIDSSRIDEGDVKIKVRTPSNISLTNSSASGLSTKTTRPEMENNVTSKQS